MGDPLYKCEACGKTESGEIIWINGIKFCVSCAVTYLDNVHEDVD